MIAPEVEEAGIVVATMIAEAEEDMMIDEEVEDMMIAEAVVVLALVVENETIAEEDANLLVVAIAMTIVVQFLRLVDELAADLTVIRRSLASSVTIKR